MSRSIIYDDNKNLAECDDWAAELIIELRAKNAALQADAERLDWLEQQTTKSGYHTELHPGYRSQSNGVRIITLVGAGPWQKSIDGPSSPTPLRTAIDAARAALAGKVSQ